MVTVIIPSYNYSKYIHDCIESVFKSDFDPDCFEIVIVDDASTDNSIEVIEKLLRISPVPMKLIINDCNTGLIRTRNRAIIHSSGELIFMLDADNKIGHDCLQKHTQVLVSNPDVSCCYAPIRDFDNATGNLLGMRSDKPYDYNLLLNGAYIDAMAMYRKKDLLEVGLFDLKMPAIGWEDYELWLRLGRNNKKVVFIEGNPLSLYRVHPDSMIKNTKDYEYNLLILYLKHKYKIRVPLKNTDQLFGLITGAEKLQEELLIARSSPDLDKITELTRIIQCYREELLILKTKIELLENQITDCKAKTMAYENEIYRISKNTICRLGLKLSSFF